MKIEAGKYYRDEDGEKVGPMRPYWETGVWHVPGPNGGTWYSDGWAVSGDTPNLVAEWSDDQKTQTRFWMVYSPQGRAPTYRHWSRTDADNEAKRLSSLNPDQEFFVLKCVGGFCASAPKIEEIAIVKGDGIPF